MPYLQNVQGQDQGDATSFRTDRTAAARYRELFQIGSGGFAKVAVALAQGIEGFSKLIVLKTLREELTSQPEAARMFLDEARLLARMNHPNIVQVHEVFRRRNAIVIVMEYVEGQPLSTIRARSRELRAPLGTDVGIAILIKVLAALNYAHTLCDFGGEPLGLIHRDVSPHNVMVTYDGQVKLLDFGIAKLAHGELANAEETRTGVIKGKLTYMAPEQLLGQVDHRVDIFAVGVMLWELATQRRFWDSVPETTIMRRLVSGELPHLIERTDMDEDLLRICAKALSHSLDQRYESAAAMQEDLERYLTVRGAVVSQAAIGQFVSETCAEARKKVQEAIREGVSTGIPVPSGDDAPWEGSVAPESVPQSARSPRFGILGLASIAAAAAVAFFVVHSRQETPVVQAAPTSAESSGAAVGTLVRLRASAQPAGAVWFLDDRKLGADPIDVRLPKDQDAHILRAELDGHQPFTRAIRMECDLEISAVLAPKASDTPQPQQARAVAAAAPIRRIVGPASRSNPSRPPTAAPVAAAAEPSPATPAAARTSQDTTAPQFGEGLRRPGTSSGRERKSIEMDYPGGNE